MRLTSRWLALIGCVGIALVAWLIWAMENTEPPGPLMTVATMGLVAALGVGPWAVLAGRKLDDDNQARRVVWRAVKVAALIAVVGTAIAVVARDSIVAMASILFAGVFALIGGVLVPWVFLLTRAVARERARRVRAEERADVAAHLHDSVLQALMLIQKRSEDSAAVRQLARGTERELRGWLYGVPGQGGGNDFTSAIREVVEEIEDRFGVTMELVAVGTCALDERARAVVGAVREALTNAAKHAGVQRVSLFAEVMDGEILVLVRDRGCGFEPRAAGGPDRRGIAHSIESRMRKQGGTAAINSTKGEGTEVELRMPLAVRT